MNSFILTETTTDLAQFKKNETLFSLGNGHIGTRGSLEESYLYPSTTENEGTYMNGFFESAPITYGESAYGYAKNSQTICKLPNGKQMSFAIDNQWFHLGTGKTTKYKREFDMYQGCLRRSFDWENDYGKKVHVEIERFISQTISEISVTHYQITPLNFTSDIQFEHRLSPFNETIDSSSTNCPIDDPRVANREKESQLQYNYFTEQDLPFIQVTTQHSKLTTYVTQFSNILHGDICAKENTKIEDGWKTTINFHAYENQKIELTVITGYSDFCTAHSTEQTDLLKQFISTINNVRKMDFSTVKQQQLDFMENFWQTGDVEIIGDEQLQQGIHFNLYHLLQAAGKDGKTNIAAKGLTGDGYEGHYFWDTEMYMIPYFIFTQPQIAKQLLMYRYHILNKARTRAKEVGVLSGALFPWRTINGDECSAYYPAGTAQFHINGDIAYALCLYDKVVEDDSFMIKYGIEILVETARFWFAFGDFIDSCDGKFCLNGVTGPDEYTALINNNYYTNLMAQANLQAAVEKVTWLKKVNKVAYHKLSEQIHLQEKEILNWQKAAEQMYFPYDEKRQLSLQDDQMLTRATWPFKDTPKENYPLLLHYHPLTIYRYQVNKQADTVLAQMLFSEKFSTEQKQRDFDYYEKITTHDSSLSKSIFGIMASEIEQKEKAYDYFMSTALMDLDDLQNNTKDGIHAANMGGTWMGLIYGFAGMRIKNHELHFQPRLPDHWHSLRFCIQFQGRTIQIKITKNQNEFILISGKPITVVINQVQQIIQ